MHGQDNYKIKEKPPVSRREIRRRAKREGRSINQTVKPVQREAAVLDDKSERKRNVAHLAGTWSKEEADEFDRAAAVFEQVEPEIWE